MCRCTGCNPEKGTFTGMGSAPEAESVGLTGTLKLTSIYRLTSRTGVSGAGHVAPEFWKYPAGRRRGYHAEQAARPGGELRAGQGGRRTRLRVAQPRPALDAREYQAVDPAQHAVGGGLLHDHHAEHRRDHV